MKRPNRSKTLTGTETSEVSTRITSPSLTSSGPAGAVEVAGSEDKIAGDEREAWSPVFKVGGRGGSVGDAPISEGGPSGADAASCDCFVVRVATSTRRGRTAEVGTAVDVPRSSPGCVRVVADP